MPLLACPAVNERNSRKTLLDKPAVAHSTGARKTLLDKPAVAHSAGVAVGQAGVAARLFPASDENVAGKCPDGQKSQSHRNLCDFKRHIHVRKSSETVCFGILLKIRAPRWEPSDHYLCEDQQDSVYAVGQA